MLAIVLLVQSTFLAAWRDRRNDEGQATAEYALVLLGVAGVALLVAVWAAETGKISDLLDTVFDKLTDSAEG